MYLKIINLIIVSLVILFLVSGCGTVRLPDGGEFTAPTIKAEMPGSNLQVAYSSFSMVGELREGDDQVAIFGRENPNRRFAILAVAEDIQTGVKEITITLSLSFRCRIRPADGDRDFGKLIQSTNSDRASRPESGSEVRQFRETAISFSLAEANEVCRLIGLQQVRGEIKGLLLVSAINYFNQSTSNSYKIKFTII